MSSAASKQQPSPTSDPLGIALFAAILVHAVLILGLSFDIQRKNPPAPEKTIDVTLVKPPKKTIDPVETPDFLAQASQEGSGEKAEKLRASNLLTNPLATPKPEPTPEIRRTVAPPEEVSNSKPVVTQQKPARKQVVRPVKKVKEKTFQQVDVSQILASTQREIDELTAELDKRSRSASNQKKRKAINASTQEYKYASYLESWRKKVERIGNLNYPDEAKRNKLYGALILHVAVNADGSIEKIRVVRSSGHRVLDDAAKRIVRLAAPYAPFPPNIRQEVDVLDITRTWKFLSGNQLFAD